MKQKIYSSQQNIAASGIALMFLLASLLFLLQSPRPAMLDVGRYDLILPQLGLTRGDFYPQDAYYTQANEYFLADHTPWTELLQLTSAPALVYPAALASLLGSFTGHVFSTETLAVILALITAFAIFFMVKALYPLIGGLGVVAGSVWGGMILCGNYLLYYNSLYSPAVFLTSLTLFAASVFRSLALTKSAEVSAMGRWLPVALSGLLLLTSTELSIALLLPVLLIVIASGWKQISRGVLLLVTGLLLFCSVRFTVQNGQIFNHTNLYHSFFDGVLTVADDPAQTLSDFGMDPEFIDDIGKSAYLSEENYYVSPNSEQAQEKIYAHLTYPCIVSYYVNHPDLCGKLAAQSLASAGHVDNSHSVYASNNSETVLRADYWDLLRTYFFNSPAAFYLLTAACMGFCILLWLTHRRKAALLLLLTTASGWMLLITALIACGTAGLEENILYFQLFSDLLICIGITALTGMIHLGVRFLAYSSLSARQKPEPLFPAEEYAPFPIRETTLFSRWTSWKQKLSTDSKAFAATASLLTLLIMTCVLFFPRIGAYNNGDFGRMMDAMGLVYTPEDYFQPEVQYEKVIEHYDYLEPYDWTRIRPDKMELTQSFLSVGMRILYNLANIPFSTAVLAAIHLLVLTLCVWQIFKAVHRHAGIRSALLLWILYLFFFCGSYNLAWLNSLFGEGIAFMGLMLVISTSIYTIEQESSSGRRLGLFLLALASIYLACAKAQYAVLVPVLLIWWLLLALGTASNLKSRILTLLVSVLLTATLGICAVNVYQTNDAVSSQDTLYSGLLNGILLYADSPEQALEDLGLDPGLVADVGKHPYLPEEDYYCPPRTEKAEELIYSKVSSVDYLLWYLRHPAAFWKLLNDTAEASADDMPDFSLYIGEYNNVPHRTVNKFNLWSDIRPACTPHWFLLYVLFFGSVILICGIHIFRRSSSARERLYAGLPVLLILTGALQYPLPMVGNGHSDPVKQLYLFREIYDMILLLVIVYAVFRLPKLKHLLTNAGRKKKENNHAST